ncbi:MAG: hypothetical protein GWP61_20245 [Chloroflexi bacterium]|jgi:quinol monooxygenase YgiN|nr:hypothetical protein [Chloroflexota bacterium]
MSIGVIVDINLKPGGAEKWTAALKERFPTTRAWDGCEEIYLCVDQNDPEHLMLVEKWASNEAYANYANGQWRSQALMS